MTGVQPRPGNPALELSAYFVFPGLVVAMVVGNQGWTLFGLLVGQLISWLVDLAALVILVHVFRRQAWPYVLAGCVVLTRVLGSGFQGSAAVDSIYLILLNVLFCAAGVAAATRYAPRVRRQVLWICLASTIVMILQTTGAGEWTQVLATENEGRPKTAYPTLFVGERDLYYQTIQARPSGLLHSNNVLSIIVLFALALHYADRSRARLDKWDVVLAVMAVLSMAKIVLVTTALMIGWLLVCGSSEQRRRMVRVAVLFAALVGLYRVLFPGLFAISAGTSQAEFSFFIRLNDFIDRLDPRNPIVTTLYPYLVDTPRLLDRDNYAGFSGYTHALALLPYLLAAALVAGPLYLLGLHRLRRRDATIACMCILVGIVAVVYPAAVPFFAAPLYWFIVGFAVPPLVLAVRPSSLQWLGPEPESSDGIAARAVSSELSAASEQAAH